MKSMRRVMEEQEGHSQSEPGRDEDGWKKEIPSWSRWFPGCPGDPWCPVCMGIGFLRVDLPISDKNFGKYVLCSCVKHGGVDEAGE